MGESLRTSSDANPDVHSFAHQVRNPLTSIQGCARTLLDRENLPAHIKRTLIQVIARQAEELELILRDAEVGSARIRDTG